MSAIWLKIFRDQDAGQVGCALGSISHQIMPQLRLDPKSCCNVFVKIGEGLFRVVRLGGSSFEGCGSVQASYSVLSLTLFDYVQGKRSSHSGLKFDFLHELFKFRIFSFYFLLEGVSQILHLQKLSVGKLLPTSHSAISV